jgi:UDPglucose 6-dehydrogenase
MKISVVGTGYVGLVTGTCFSEVGIDVTCIDIDKNKINNLKKGILPIYEPGLNDLVTKNVNKKRLHFTTNLPETLDGCEVIFIAVGTPPDEDGSADLKHVLSVAREIGKNLNDYIVIATKSTVPAGTAQKVKAAVHDEIYKRGIKSWHTKSQNSELGTQNLFDVASNPEFLKEGAAVEDFLKPDRIVIGVNSEKAKEIMSQLYKPFTLNGHPIIFMDIASAEMTKYAANSMLATKISFMNDIANLCEIIGADINMVRKGIGSDSRIGYKFIYPGVGYGGSCFPKDVKALIKTGKEHNHNMRVLRAVEEVNDDQKSVLFNKALKYFNQKSEAGSQKSDLRPHTSDLKVLKGKTAGIWGLSFKPETDDMREAPSLVIIEKLLKAGVKVKVYDPVAMKEAKHKLGDSVYYAKDDYDALKDADCMFLITEWKEFRFPNLDLIKKIMKSPVIFDGRNIYDRMELEKKGFVYFCIGQKSS